MLDYILWYLLIILLAFALSRFKRLSFFTKKKYYRPRRAGISLAPGSTCHPVSGTSSRAKPAWVKPAVIALSMHYPQLGSRRLAHAFNLHYFENTHVGVGKTFVADTLQAYRLACARRRQAMRLQSASTPPIHAVWGLDFTHMSTHSGPVLGIIDHGSRAILSLEALSNKATITLLRALLNVIEKVGKPQAIRTDNEAVFTSRLFSFCLYCLGIQHQRTKPHCPWQNGRIERFFGTLKRELGSRFTLDKRPLNLLLHQFAYYYNHHRPHQALNNVTPSQAWRTLPIAKKKAVKKRKPPIQKN